MSEYRIQSEVFLRRDIENILRGIDRANAALAVHLTATEVAIYRAGFTAAMRAVATAFDVVVDSRPTEPDIGPYLPAADGRS